jgi:hypothetical protein
MVLPIRSIKNSKEIEELLTAMKLKVAFTPLF